MQQYFDFIHDIQQNLEEEGFKELLPYVMYYQIGDLYQGNKVAAVGKFSVSPKSVVQYFSYKPKKKIHPQQADLTQTAVMIAVFGIPAPQQRETVIRKFLWLFDHRDTLIATLNDAPVLGLINPMTMEMMPPTDSGWKKRYDLLQDALTRAILEIDEMGKEFPHLYVEAQRK